MFTGEAATLIAAVDEGFDAQVALTADLVPLHGSYDSLGWG
jgi:hypothetical protein